MQVLHSRIIGKGEPLLVLHGYFGNGDNWKTIANNLSNRLYMAVITKKDFQQFTFIIIIIKV